MRTRPRLTALITATVASLVLAGCAGADPRSSGEPEEAGVGPLSAPPGSTPEAAQVGAVFKDPVVVVPRDAVTMTSFAPGDTEVPPMPLEVLRDDEVGAAAAAAYFWVDAFPALDQLGDGTAVAAMSHPSCDLCSAAVATGEPPSAESRRSVTDAQEWHSATVAHPADATYVVTLGLEATTIRTYDETGAPVLRITTGFAPEEVTLTRLNGTWLVLDYRPLSDDEHESFDILVAASGVVPAESSEPEPAATLPLRAPIDVERPVPPADMSRPDVRGAEEAAAYFAGDLRRYTGTSQDLAEYQAMSAPECFVCTVFPMLVAEQQDEQTYMVQDELRSEPVGSRRIDDRSVEVLVHIEGSRSELRSWSGELLQTTEPFSDDLSYLMVHDGTRWLVGDITLP